MKETEYGQMAKFEKKYWWHVGRKFILAKILKKWAGQKTKNNLIIDFGCGTGGNFEFLERFGKVIGIDNSETALAFCSGKSATRLFNGNNIPFPDDSADLITTLDVLEHIDNDSEILKEHWRVLKKNGKILITVPAYRFIWSEHDEALGHRRRYIAGELKNKLRQNGFRVVKISYAVTFVFPIILFYRVYKGIFPNNPLKPKTSYVILPEFINRLFINFMKLESLLIDRISLPFGCSIIAFAEKIPKTANKI